MFQIQQKTRKSTEQEGRKQLELELSEICKKIPFFFVAPRRQNCIIGKKNWKYNIQNAGIEVWFLARNTFALYKDDEKSDSVHEPTYNPPFDHKITPANVKNQEQHLFLEHQFTCTEDTYHFSMRVYSYCFFSETHACKLQLELHVN